MGQTATMGRVRLPESAGARFRVLTGPEIEDGARLAIRAFVRGWKRVWVLREGIGADARQLHVFTDV